MVFNHIPVLFEKTLELLDVENPKLFVDLTGGGGGHSSAFIEKYPNMKAVIVDRDLTAVNHLKSRFKENPNVKVVHSKSSEIEKILFLLKAGNPDIILADLGVSSIQLDLPQRGFSDNKEGPLDMRMDESSSYTALDLLKEKTVAEIQRILSEYAQERESKRVAVALKNCVEAGCEKTLEFRDAVLKAKRFKKSKGDPVAKIFMALRIAVNDEIGELEKMLLSSFRVLNDGGKMGFISFHSVEDRVVKRFFNDRRQLLPVNDGTKFGFVKYKSVKLFSSVVASQEEIEENSRSRSARLRVLQINK